MIRIALVVLAVLVVGLGVRQVAGERPLATPVPRTVEPSSVPDGPLGEFHGVLVQRMTHFATSNSNDSIPDFDRQVYDTDGAWDPSAPDRITIPWGGMTVLNVHAAWAGHEGRWVELKLYCGAERPIGNDQEHRLVGVVQSATNPDSPFLELTTPPLPLEAGTECFIALKSPTDELAISYQAITTTFGAFVP
jgi:hypothetical protein